MAVAAEVAREWKARETAAGAVPPVPEVVQARLAGVWAGAVQAARGEHERAVEGWCAQLEQVEAGRVEAISAADEQGRSRGPRRRADGRDHRGAAG